MIWGYNRAKSSLGEKQFGYMIDGLILKRGGTTLSTSWSCEGLSKSLRPRVASEFPLGQEEDVASLVDYVGNREVLVPER